MTKVEPAFKGSEEDFTLVTGLICHFCLTKIAEFAALKAKYTPEMIQGILDSLQKAASMPNLQQRQSTSTALRAVLVNTGAVSCTNYLTLASYIESSFSADKMESMKKLAGGAYLNDARKNNWSSVSTMNKMMLTFIDTYSDDLTNGDMPADFPDTCSSGSVAFTKALDAYETNKQTSEQQVQDRTAAFNRVNTSLKGIMRDGKLIYRNDPETRKQFTYSAVLKKISKNNRSGFRIEVTDSITQTPVITASVQFIEGEWLFKANQKGIILAKLPQGEYNGTVTATGYSPVQVKFTSNKGVMHREQVTLAPVAQKVLAE